jgi:predicted type IV restriction endonuclease
MSLENHIESIAENIKAGKFLNEASVSQGIVLRILQELGWPIFDSSIVIPEYTLEGRRVDYALCNQKNKPIAFIEVKQVGKATGAEVQLFEYAFIAGIPLAILTDGQEWHFFLPAEQGNIQERRVYMLDLLERSSTECAERFQRYLDYEKLKDGSALTNARKDYKNISKKKDISTTLPLAWMKLLEENDELLIELVSEKVETLCGYQPDPDTVGAFLSELAKPTLHQYIPSTSSLPSSNPGPKVVNSNTQKSRAGFNLKGKSYESKNARGVLINVLNIFAKDDKDFLPRFESRPKHGKKRRYLSRDKFMLYPDRPDLCEDHSHELIPGWFIGTNYSKAGIRKILRMACEVAGIQFDVELTVFF